MVPPYDAFGQWQSKLPRRERSPPGRAHMPSQLHFQCARPGASATVRDTRKLPGLQSCCPPLLDSHWGVQGGIVGAPGRVVGVVQGDAHEGR